jgi:hypothetical protein
MVKVNLTITESTVEKLSSVSAGYKNRAQSACFSIQLRYVVTEEYE